MNLSGMSYKTTVDAKAFDPEAFEAEYCTCNGCEYIEYAFHDSSTDEWKNDKTSFLVRRGATTETWTFKLFKDGVFVANITNSTLGEYYGFGDLLYSDLKGIVIYWRNVYNAHGNGDYTIRITKTFAGTDVIQDSHIYRVRPYSFAQAMGTVKVESYQNGTFIGTGWTYRDLEWYQSVRVRGKFWNKTPQIESIEYVDSDRQRNPVWDKITNTYDLELHVIPSFITNQIVYSQSVANLLYVTDYNINFEVYRKWPIRLQSFSSSKYYDKNTYGSYIIKVTDRSEGTIKGY